MSNVLYTVNLYKNHGKGIGIWSARAFEDGEVRIEHSKTLLGTRTEKIYHAEPKNVGKANETSAGQQAVLEVQSRQRKQLDKGYVHTLEEAKQPVTNAMGLEPPMLATPLEKVKPESIDWDSAFVQPKLDGHRALYKDGVLYSRQGKELNLPHIVEAIESTGLKHLHLDGEIYLHGLPLQEISKLIKKERPETKDLQYYIYDTVDEASFLARSNQLLFCWTQHKSLKRVDTHIVSSEKELMAWHKRYRKEGYEGTMLRFGDDPYLIGKRARTLLKVKEFQDAEFTIVGYQEGKPYITEQGTFRVPVWVCDAGNGKLFNVTAQGNMQEKHELWETKNQHINKPLTVKYHYLSNEGIPQLPVALRFHETV